jgi:hypothetical protein
MSRILKVVLVAGGLMGYSAGSMGAFAQGGPGMMMPGMMMPGMMMTGMMMERMTERGLGPFAGFFIRRDNKNLTNDEVRKIAEAGLLWFGERTWRIGEVTDAGRAARFTLTTENGGVIATFEMDRNTGRVRRVG